MSLAVIETRKFPTRVVLCVATKTIPDSRLMPEIYTLLEFMTGGPVSTSQLAAAMQEAHRFLVYRNPKLMKGFESIATDDADALAGWFEQQQKATGELFTVVRN
jgi:hypothetical protein